MLRIPLRDLEKALEDPPGYRASRTSGIIPPYSKHSFFLTLRNAIFRFHSSADNEQIGFDYLIDHLADFKSASGKIVTTDQYGWYIRDYRNRANKCFECKKRVVVPLPYSTRQPVVISGEVSRLDVDNKYGYYAWLFVNKGAINWVDEIRMPLIQYVLAVNEFKVPVNEVRVGIYNFEDRVVGMHTYSNNDITRSINKLSDLLRDLDF